MKHVIHKHDLDKTVTELTLPYNSVLLFVGIQGRSIRLWEMHNVEEQHTSVRTFEIVATGQHTVIDPIKYIGSVMLDEGRTVFHVFETTERQREPRPATNPLQKLRYELPEDEANYQRYSISVGGRRE